MSNRVRIAALIWASSILLSRVIGLLREAVLGRTLGAGADADLYQAAFAVPEFFHYLLAGGALSVVLIPLLVEYLERDENDAMSESFSVIATTVSLLMVVVTALAWIALPSILRYWYPGFSEPAQEKLVELSRIILPSQVFHVVGGLASAALQARDRHTLPALAPLIYTGSIVAGGLVGGTELGPYGFAWGVLVGSILGPFLLPLLGALRCGLRWRLRFTWTHPDLRRYFVSVFPIMLGFSIVMADDWIFKRLASELETGSVAIMGYARTLMRVPMGVFGLAMGAASFPLMSRQAAAQNYVALTETLSRAVRQVLILALGAQVVFSVSGAQISRIIYGTRLSFEQHVLLGENLTLMCIALGAWSTHNLFARVFYAQGRTWIPTVVGTTCVLIAYPGYVMAGQTWGTLGLAGVGSLAMLVYVCTLGVWVRQSLGQELRLLAFLFKSLLATASGVGAGFMARASGLSIFSFDRVTNGTLDAVISGAMLGWIGLFGYGIALWIFRVSELQVVLSMIRRRLLRNRSSVSQS